MAVGQMIPRVVVILLYGGRDHPGHTDPIAAHGKRHRVPCSSKHTAFIFSLYFTPSWKMCPTSIPRAMDSGSPCGLASPSTTLRRSAAVGRGEVTLPVDTGQVLVGCVRTAYESRPSQCRVVRDHRDLDAHRADGARAHTHLGLDSARAGKAQRCGDAFDLAAFRHVELVVAAQQQGNQATVSTIDQQCLQALRSRHLELLAERSMVCAPGVSTRCHRFARRRTRRGRCGEGTSSMLAAKVAAGSEGDGVLTGLGQHVKLMRDAAADGARVGPHDAEFEPGAREDPRIGSYITS